MSQSLSCFATISSAVCLCVLGACSARPVLESKSAAVPVGVNLSGYWLAREKVRAAKPRSMTGSDDALITMSQSQRQQRSRKRNSSGVSAQVFLESGDTLKITQTDHGVFISYDRSVVEEYTFGENRMVSIGPIEAQRVSGWEANSFIVETLDTSGTVLAERWHLENDDAVLVRDISMSKDEYETYSEQQTFDRR